MKVLIESNQGTWQIESKPGERLLYCGLRHGFKLPYECASGTCSTCRAVLLSGKVESIWENAPGARVLRAHKNEILLCQSVAKNNPKIKVRPGQRPPSSLPVPQNLSGQISNFRMLNDDVAEFYLELEVPIECLPGQFITVSVDGIDGYRAYSMTDLQELPKSRIPFLVKRIPEGKFTQWLFEKSRNGSKLQAFGPLGRAIFSSKLDGNYVAIVGGTGIAGIMSILRSSIHCGHLENHHATLVFGLNRVQDAFYFEELHRMCEDNRNLCVNIAFTDMSGSDQLRRKFPLFCFVEGFLHEASATLLNDLSDISVAFVAGPPMAVNTTRMMLIRKKKFPVRKIRYDLFG